MRDAPPKTLNIKFSPLIMKLIQILIIIIIPFIFILLLKQSEKFTVPFKPYQEPYWGYCYPNLSDQEFATGNYQTQCWSNFAYDDCQKLMANGFNCGRNIKTGETIPCLHSEGKCKERSQCFSTCFENVDIWKQPYMIKVTRQDLIALSPN